MKNLDVTLIELLAKPILEIGDHLLQTRRKKKSNKKPQKRIPEEYILALSHSYSKNNEEKKVLEEATPPEIIKPLPLENTTPKTVIKPLDTPIASSSSARVATHEVVSWNAIGSPFIRQVYSAHTLF